MLLNKADVTSGSVVAARSVADKQFTEEDALLAGVPAKVHRVGATWTHEFPVDNGAVPRSIDAGP